MDFRQRYPQFEIGMVEGSRLRPFAALPNGAIDMRGAPISRAASCRCGANAFLIAVLDGHPQAAKKAIYWTDLRHETVLLSHYDPGRELEDVLMARLVSTSNRAQIERHDISRGIIKTRSLSVSASASLPNLTSASILRAYLPRSDGTGPSQFHYSADWRKDNDDPALTNYLKLLSKLISCPA